MASDWERQAEQKALQRQLAKERRAEAYALTSREEKGKIRKGRKKLTKSRDTKLSPTRKRNKPMAKKKVTPKKKLPKVKKAGKFLGKAVGRAYLPLVAAKGAYDNKKSRWRGARDALVNEIDYLTCAGEEDNNVCIDLGADPKRMRKRIDRRNKAKKAQGFAKGGLVNARGIKVKQCRGGGKATRGLNFID